LAVELVTSCLVQMLLKIFFYFKVIDMYMICVTVHTRVPGILCSRAWIQLVMSVCQHYWYQTA